MYTKDNMPNTAGHYTEDIMSPNYWLAIMIFVFIGGIISTFAIAKYKQNYEVSRLQNRADNIAASIDTNLIKDLSGSMEDLTNPSYLRLKNTMYSIKNVNPDARFIYLMGKRDNKLFFFVDSEPEDSKDYSAPGETYQETTLEEYNNFINGKRYTEGPYKDSWGSWISSNSPIIDRETNSTLAKVGIDINSKEWEQNIIYAAMLPGSLTITLTIISFLFYLSQRKRAEVIRNRLEFVSIASHQLRTPLTAIKWYSESLLKSQKIEGEDREYLQNISDSNDRMIRLVGNMVDTTYIDTDKIELKKVETDLKELLDTVQIDLTGLLRKHNINIKYKEGFPETIDINLDQNRIRQVFVTILSNSIKYSKENGEINIGYKESNNRIIISIEDNGLGIPEKTQSRVFQRFFRADNAKTVSPNGSGLGLYVAKDIVEKHGGKLYFTSKENVGTTFFIEIPKIW